jgi:hypothetical protein
MTQIVACVARLPRDADIAGVIAGLERIERERDGFFVPGGPAPAERAARAPRPDGVACFNAMYLAVTRAVQVALPAFESPAFVSRLDVVFAEFYLEACRAATERAWISRAWAPLFEAREDPRILPLQFAIAGMNAHINNDLSYALVQTWRELGLRPGDDTPEHRDFVRINGILEAVEARIKPVLLDPFIADLDHLLGRIDDRLALWSVAKARADAWDRALELSERPGRGHDDLHDRLVGFAGHLLLSPLV